MFCDFQNVRDIYKQPIDFVASKCFLRASSYSVDVDVRGGRASWSDRFDNVESILSRISYNTMFKPGTANYKNKKSIKVLREHEKYDNIQNICQNTNTNKIIEKSYY